MKKTALVIMAAGIGSRFGKGIKQLAQVGPSGEIIMDYSIHDALEAGFNKVVFIIRKDRSVGTGVPGKNRPHLHLSGRAFPSCASGDLRYWKGDKRCLECCSSVIP